MRQPVSRAVLAGLVIVGLTACEEEAAPPPRHPFTFAVNADGDPLAGVQITVNDGSVGATDAEGVLRVDLTGPEGASVRVAAVCPEGHRRPDPQVYSLRRVQSLDPATAARGIEVAFNCPPERRNAVVVVRTHEQAGVPVMLDGREVARTDASGAAHLHVAMAPGTTFLVQLDTRHNDRLRPRSPGQSYTLPDRDEVFVLDQRFSEEQPPPVRRRPVRRREPEVRLPIRIPSGR
jgi:hypothetical protein